MGSPATIKSMINLFITALNKDFDFEATKQGIVEIVAIEDLALDGSGQSESRRAPKLHDSDESAYTPQLPLSYHRIVRGDAKQKHPSTDDLTILTYEMRMIVMVKKPEGPEHSDNQVFMQAAAKISNFDVFRFSRENNISGIQTEVTGFDLDRFAVHTTETVNVEMPVSFDFTYLAIEYTVTITGSLSCMVKC